MIGRNNFLARLQGRPKHHTRSPELPTDWDPDLYLKANKDVALAGSDPTQHYLAYGKKEARRLRPEIMDAVVFEAVEAAVSIADPHAISGLVQAKFDIKKASPGCLLRASVGGADLLTKKLAGPAEFSLWINSHRLRTGR